MSARTIKISVFFVLALIVSGLSGRIQTGRSGGMEIPFIDPAVTSGVR
jgi:hypothetical protein